MDILYIVCYNQITKIIVKIYDNRKGLDIMTMQRQKEILTQIMELVTEMAEDNSDAQVTAEPMAPKG